jgi:acetyl esterase/lipase
VDRIEASFLHMAGLPGIRPERLGLFGISITGGFALAAATRPSIASSLDFAIMVGTFYDLRGLTEFAMSGRYRVDGQVHQARPELYVRWTYLYNFAHLALDGPDLEAAREALRLRLDEDWPAAESAVGRLSERARGFLERADAGAPELLEPLASRIETELRPFLGLISPQVGLCRLRGRLFVFHGRGDPVIPYSESVAMAQACGACPQLECDLLLTQLYQHVGRGSPFQGLWHRLRYEVPELMRYYAFLYRILWSMLV